MHSSATSGGCPLDNEVQQGDTWAKAHLDAYATWAVSHNSLLIITWDENGADYATPTSCANGINTTPPFNHIATLIIGAHVKPGSVNTTTYTHYNVLRTIEEMEGITTPLGGSAKVPPITCIWQ